MDVFLSEILRHITVYLRLPRIFCCEPAFASFSHGLFPQCLLKGLHILEAEEVFVDRGSGQVTRGAACTEAMFVTSTLFLFPVTFFALLCPDPQFSLHHPSQPTHRHAACSASKLNLESIVCYFPPEHPVCFLLGPYHSLIVFIYVFVYSFCVSYI